MSNPFHLAIPAGDLSVATKFYVDVLGCKLGNGEANKWIDVDFWGNELTLHKTEMKLPNERHDVDMGNVPVPHFGVHLDKGVFNKIKENLKSNNIKYLDEPYTRFKDKKEQQETFFIKDPHGNILELKTLQN
ncbi:glyoxalase [Candidatus Pelagibacter bacterium]|jgi:extradiol dioxygenase family protein|nr:glyoxalase [Candidatus Pelagibacter bacterium]